MKKLLVAIESKKSNGPTVTAEQLSSLFQDLGYEVDQLKTYKNSSIFSLDKLLWMDTFIFYSQTFTALIFMLMGKLFGKKTVYILHGDLMREFEDKKGLKSIFWLPIHIMVFKICNYIVSPSEYTFRINNNNFPSLVKKHIVIPNPLIKDEIPKRSDNFLNVENNMKIVTQTSFRLKEKAKGVSTIVNLLSDKVGYHLYIIGDGPLLDRYKDKYSSDSITFLGHLHGLRYKLKEYDLMLHVSYLDNVPVIIEEALSANLPLVALNTGGIKEITNEYVYDDEQSMKIAIDKIFESRAKTLSDIQVNQKLEKNSLEIQDRWQKLFSRV